MKTYCQKILLIVMMGLCFFAIPAYAKELSVSAAKRAPSMYFAAQRTRYSFEHFKKISICDYFAPNFVWDIRHYNSHQEFEKMKSALRQINPEITMSLYISASLAMPRSQESYPPSRIPLESCPSEWLIKGKFGKPFDVKPDSKREAYFLNMLKKEVRQAVITLAITRAKHFGFQSISFDNCYYMRVHPLNPISKKDWTNAFMDFYKEADEEIHGEGMTFVVNVGSPPEYIPEAFEKIAPYVDGILTEQAFHTSIRTPESIYKELKAYEKVLNQGKKVFLISTQDNEDFALLAIRPLAKKYGNIHYASIGLTHHNPLYRLSEIDWNISD
jgi:hypothetical protein